jgi:hypothetical protein
MKVKQGFEIDKGGFRSLVLEKHIVEGQEMTCCSIEAPSAIPIFPVAYL